MKSYTVIVPTVGTRYIAIAAENVYTARDQVRAGNGTIVDEIIKPSPYQADWRVMEVKGK